MARNYGFGIDTVAEFVTDGYGSYANLTGKSRADCLVAYRDDPRIGSLISKSYTCSTVAVWRTVYNDWCRSNLGLEPVSATMFARRIRDLLSLGTRPSSKRFLLNGKRVQFRVFVDAPRTNKQTATIQSANGSVDRSSVVMQDNTILSLGQVLSGTDPVLDDNQVSKSYVFCATDAIAYMQRRNELSKLFNQTDDFGLTLFDRMIEYLKANYGKSTVGMRVSKAAPGFVGTDCDIQWESFPEGNYLVSLTCPGSLVAKFANRINSGIVVPDDSFVRLCLWLRGFGGTYYNPQDALGSEIPIGDLTQAFVLSDKSLMNMFISYVESSSNNLVGMKTYYEYVFDDFSCNKHYSHNCEWLPEIFVNNIFVDKVLELGEMSADLAPYFRVTSLYSGLSDGSCDAPVSVSPELFNDLYGDVQCDTKYNAFFE